MNEIKSKVKELSQYYMKNKIVKAFMILFAILVILSGPATWIGLGIILAITYFQVWVAYKVVTWFLSWSGLNKTDWFYDINEENKQMDKSLIKKIGVGVVSVGWLVMLCAYGWWVLLWSIIGIAIGAIIKTLKENGI